MNTNGVYGMGINTYIYTNSSRRTTETDNFASKGQKNNSRIKFASRMEDMVGTNVPPNSRKAYAVLGQDNYVSENIADIYGMGVYSRKRYISGTGINPANRKREILFRRGIRVSR